MAKSAWEDEMPIDPVEAVLKFEKAIRRSDETEM
jgi:hypothetical protein